MGNNIQAIILKPGREVHARNHHPWVFLGAVDHFPEFENGSILAVHDHLHNFLGYGYFNRGQSIVGRMISFRQGDPLETIKNNIYNAISLRAKIIKQDTNCYRLINAEGDFLPGLIVDKYNSVLVIQINTLGMERLKSLIVETLTKSLSPSAIYEKSSTSTRQKEGLSDVNTVLTGKVEGPIEVMENGLKFLADVVHGQKTGLFLDQRNMRELVKKHAQGRSVLNCFAYTGGFSVYSLSGGAIKAVSLDTDKRVNTLTQTNLELNGFSKVENEIISEDAFNYLERTAQDKTLDFIILDPPAFAKRASDIENASRGYRELNRLALEKLPPSGLLLTSSCSSHIDRQLFQTIIFQAAKDARRNVKILSYHLLAPDHPVNIYYPEGDYLKSLLLWVE